MKTEQKNNFLWYGLIPEIFGYGILIFAKTEKDAKTRLKKAFYEFRDTCQSSTKFDDAFDRWGGRIAQIEFNKTYYDNIGS